ncbi:hypothetical protein NLX83_22480 [Allokutzneria sp. A3M-2-11 16]|uniref:hypothetical protein n=1 Tax=Allokutzneria sp. A3M-2-11 16 TaxID=2962043 RepID=UPI0020B72024|nr:hypothetical protein [Allokutzneria sp. A3M-2-11 16]MCP3802037.1 hypothetical protein [Allokutzneria sp. A3M-2-11 16]
MGARSIACLNSRDRNVLGFRRDLLTAAAYGVERFLFVYGDKPTAGGRTSELTVRTMIEQTRVASEDPAFGSPIATATADRLDSHSAAAPRSAECRRQRLRRRQIP